MLRSMTDDIYDEASEQNVIPEDESTEVQRSEADEPPVEEPEKEPSTEEPPAEEPAEEPPVEEPPVEEPPVEEPVAEPEPEPPVEEPVVEEAPVEPPVEEPPVEEPVVEPEPEPVVEEPVAEEAPVEPPVEEPPVEEPVAEPVPAPPVEESPSDGAITEDAFTVRRPEPEPAPAETPTEEPPASDALTDDVFTVRRPEPEPAPATFEPAVEPVTEPAAAIPPEEAATVEAAAAAGPAAEPVAPFEGAEPDGTVVSEPTTEEPGPATFAPAAAAATVVPKPKKKINKKLIGIIAGALAVILIVVAVIAYLATPRDLVINGGSQINATVGFPVELTVTGEGLKDVDYSLMEWLVTDEAGQDLSSVAKAEGNQLTPYDAKKVVLEGHYKKGIRKWDGTVPVNIEFNKLEINGGNSIEVYLGDKKAIKVTTDLTEEQIGKIEWSSGNENVFTVKNGEIVPKSAGSAALYGNLKDGIKVWKGSCSVVTKYKKVSYHNGDQIKRSPGRAPVKVNNKEARNLYIYFKNKSGGKDFSFLVKAGKSASVTAATGKYEVYYAFGDTWYGPKYLFGDSTSYRKSEKKLKFYVSGNYIYGTELTLQTIYGNVEGGSAQKIIDKSEFPN